MFQLKKYKCAECGYSCYLKTDLERHLTNVHQKQRTACPVCGKRYSDLRQHIRLVHEGHKVSSREQISPRNPGFDNPVSSLRVYIPCTTWKTTAQIIMWFISGFLWLTKPGFLLLQISIRVLTLLILQLECPQCHKKYTNLSQHINKMHKKIRKAQCDKCGKTFYLESQLRRHDQDVHSY